MPKADSAKRPASAPVVQHDAQQQRALDADLAIDAYRAASRRVGSGGLTPLTGDSAARIVREATIGKGFVTRAKGVAAATVGLVGEDTREKKFRQTIGLQSLEVSPVVRAGALAQVAPGSTWGDVIEGAYGDLLASVPANERGKQRAELVRMLIHVQVKVAVEEQAAAIADEERARIQDEIEGQPKDARPSKDRINAILEARIAQRLEAYERKAYAALTLNPAARGAVVLPGLDFTRQAHAAFFSNDARFNQLLAGGQLDLVAELWNGRGDFASRRAQMLAHWDARRARDPKVAAWDARVRLAAMTTAEQVAVDRQADAVRGQLAATRAQVVAMRANLEAQARTPPTVTSKVTPAVTVKRVSPGVAVERRAAVVASAPAPVPTPESTPVSAAVLAAVPSSPVAQDAPTASPYALTPQAFATVPDIGVAMSLYDEATSFNVPSLAADSVGSESAYSLSTSGEARLGSFSDFLAVSSTSRYVTRKNEEAGFMAWLSSLLSSSEADSSTDEDHATTSGTPAAVGAAQLESKQAERTSNRQQERVAVENRDSQAKLGRAQAQLEREISSNSKNASVRQRVAEQNARAVEDTDLIADRGGIKQRPAPTGRKV